jgi:hypothetical protein
MDLKDIMSISGKGGLFRSIAQTKNGLIIESLVDKKRFPVYASDKVSSLEDIRIFTKDKDVPLKDVIEMIFKKESGGHCIDPKSDDAKLKKYFEEVLPDYDKERVYTSDIRKLFSWYNLLQSLGLLKLEEEEKKEEKSEKENIEKEEKPEEKE